MLSSKNKEHDQIKPDSRFTLKIKIIKAQIGRTNNKAIKWKLIKYEIKNFERLTGLEMRNSISR